MGVEDGRFSILGTIEGNLISELEKVSKVGGNIEKSIDTADKKLTTFLDHVKSLGTTLNKTFQPTGFDSASQQRIQNTFDRQLITLKDFARKVNATGDVAAQGTQKVATGFDGLDTSSIRLADRSAKLTARLLSMQFALGQLNTLGFGKFQGYVDAGTASLQTFASVVAVLPSSLGLALGGALGLAAGIAKLTFNAFEEIAAIERKSKELTDKSDASRIRNAQTKAQEKVTFELATPEERANIALKEQEDLLRTKANTIATNGQKEITNARDLKKIENDITKLEAERKEALQAIELLQHDATAVEGGALGQQQTIALAAASAIAALQKKQATLVKSQSELAASTADLTDEYNRNLYTYSVMEQKQKDAEGAKKFREELNKLESTLRAVREENLKGNIDDVTYAQKKFDLEKQIYDIKSRGARFVSDEKQSQDAAIAAQADKLRASQDDLELAREIADVQRGYDFDTEKRRDKAKKDAEDKAKDMRAFYEGIAQGIGQAFAQATSTLIDGFIQGRLNMQEFAGQFLLQIAKMIAEALVLKAVMAGLGVIGLNSGGEVPTGFENNHYATGGNVPGPNVDADVVPAMLTPGEFVMRKSAVQHYGRDVMASMNRGLVPRSALGGVSSSSVVNTSGHFAEGGEIPYGAGAAPKPAMAVVVSSDNELDRLLAGGDGAMIRFLERRKSKVRAALGVGGR